MHRERLPLTLFGELREMVQISRNQSLSKNALLCHINTYNINVNSFSSSSFPMVYDLQRYKFSTIPNA